MSWRVAKSLLTLREQVNARWPNRRKDSDGTIGNDEHAVRHSDHNPDENGVVCAMDITHDPQSGCDSYALAENLRLSRDRRISYIISNRRICSSSVDAWQWRPYHGKNPHDHHCHVSVIDTPKLYDDVTPWDMDAKPMPAPVKVLAATPQTVRKGDTGEEVTALQEELRAKGIALRVDGEFGPATVAAVKKFQQSRGLVVDGTCGPQTWSALK